MTISFGYILHCVCFNLYCGGFILFCNVCVCVCVCGFYNVCVCVCMCGFCNVRACVCECVCLVFIMCGCLGNKYTVL